MAAPIHAHGATILVTASAIKVLPTALASALGATPSAFAISSISEVRAVETPTATTPGMGLIEFRDGSSHAVAFPPNSSAQLEEFLQRSALALAGELPLEEVLPGLDFVAVHVSTTNPDWGSVCGIEAVRLIGGVIAERFFEQCRPPASLGASDPRFGAGDLPEDARDFAEVYADFVGFSGSALLVAHNAQFTFSALKRACEASGIEVSDETFGCTLALVRAAYPDAPKTDLNSAAMEFEASVSDSPFSDSPFSDSPASTTAAIVISAALEAGLSNLEGLFHHHGLSLGQLNASRVYPVLRLPNRPTATPLVQEPRPQSTWARAATPEEIPETNTDADSSGLLFGHTVVLTGDFNPFDKGLLWEKMAERGATVAKNVTKKTTMLVIGPWENVTSKQKRAEELNEKGQGIIFLSAEQLFAELGLDAELQPPF